MVRYAARVNGITALAVTKLDVLDGLDRIPVASGYRLDGELLDEFPAEAGSLERVEPVYRVLEGWKSRTAEARTLSDLPARARAYLEQLETLAGIPVRYVSVGTRRDQIIEL